MIFIEEAFEWAVNRTAFIMEWIGRRVMPLWDRLIYSYDLSVMLGMFLLVVRHLPYSLESSRLPWTKRRTFLHGSVTTISFSGCSFLWTGRQRWEGISSGGDLEVRERCAAGIGPGGHGNSGWKRKLLFDR